MCVHACAYVSEGKGGEGARQGEEGVHAYIHACTRIWVEMENYAYALRMSVHDGDGKDGFGGGGGGGGGAIRHAPIITKLLFLLL